MIFLTNTVIGNRQVIHYLVEVCGLSTRLLDSSLRSALHLACSKGHLSTVAYLLKNQVSSSAIVYTFDFSCGPTFCCNFRWCIRRIGSKLLSCVMLNSGKKLSFSVLLFSSSRPAQGYLIHNRPICTLSKLMALRFIFVRSCHCNSCFL